MQIKRVTLQNWRSHKDTKLDFSKGTNMLVGIMGSGKSSVLEAICFALYGTFPALARKRVKLGQIVTEGTNGADCRAEIVFEKDGKEYTLARTISDGKGDAELREGTRMIETKSEAVTRMVEHILGVNYDLFSKAIYSEQNSLDYFLSLNPGDRKKQIDDLIGIDRFELARANSTKLANRIAEEIGELERQIGSYDKGALSKEKENTGKLVKEARERQATLKSELAEITNKANELKNKKEALELKRKSYEDLSRQHVECSTFIESVGKGLKNYRSEDAERVRGEIANAEKEIAGLRNDSAAMDRALTEASRKIGEIETNLKSADAKKKESGELKKKLTALGAADDAQMIRKEIEVLNSQLVSAEKGHGSSNAESALLKKDIAKLEREVAELEQLRKDADMLSNAHQRTLDDTRHSDVSTIEWIASLREIIKITQESIVALEREGGGLCPMCEGPLDKQKRDLLVIKRKETIENSHKELAENEAKQAKLKKEIQKLEVDLKRKAELGTRLEGFELKARELKEKSEKMKSLELSAKESEAKITELKKSIAEQGAKASKADEAALLRQRIDDADKFISQHAGDRAALDDLQKKHNDDASALGKMRESLSESEKELVKKKSMVEEIARDLELQAKVQQKSAQFEKVKSDIAGMDYKEELLTESLAAHNDALVKKKGLEVNAENISKNAELMEKNLGMIEKQLADVEGREKELGNMRDAASKAKEFQQSVIETQVLLRNELVNSINAVMDKIWDVIYPYGDFTQVKLEASESDYVLKAKRNNDWVVVEGNVSGGERASVALALRVAFSIVLAPNMSMLVLDEPTHNLDENGVKSLSEILRERLPKIMEQSFIITHDENLKEGASGRLYTFNRNKRAREPTQIVSDSV